MLDAGTGRQSLTWMLTLPNLRRWSAITADESMATTMRNEVLGPCEDRAAVENLILLLRAAAEGTYAPQQSEAEIEALTAENEATAQRLMGVVEALAASFPQQAPQISSLVQTVMAG